MVIFKGLSDLYPFFADKLRLGAGSGYIVCRHSRGLDIWYPFLWIVPPKKISNLSRIPEIML